MNKTPVLIALSTLLTACYGPGEFFGNPNTPPGPHYQNNGAPMYNRYHHTTTEVPQTAETPAAKVQTTESGVSTEPTPKPTSMTTTTPQEGPKVPGMAPAVGQ